MFIVYDKLHNKIVKYIWISHFIQEINHLPCLKKGNIAQNFFDSDGRNYGLIDLNYNIQVEAKIYYMILYLESGFIELVF